MRLIFGLLLLAACLVTGPARSDELEIPGLRADSDAYVRTLRQGFPAGATTRQRADAEARAQARLLLDADPANPAYREAAATAAVGLGDQEDAIALYGQLLAERLDAPDVHLWLGHALKTVGRRDEAIALIGKHLKRGARIRLSGFGVFQVKKRAARKGRNPATGDEIKIKASKRVVFAAARDLKTKL